MAVVILAAFYFVVKWAVKNGIKEAHQEMIDEDLRQAPIHNSEHKA